MLPTPLRLLFCAAFIFAGAPAQADSLQADYRITLLGLPIGNANLSVDLTRTHYAIKARAALSGLASMVSNSKGATNGSGAIVNGRISPSDYATTASNSSMTRTIRMTMAGNAQTGVDISPPFDDKPDRVPLTGKDLHDIVDPAGAFILPGVGDQPLVGASACDRTISILDGYTRFDVTLAYVGMRDVKVKGYSGPVAICSARYIPIAGHRPNRPGTKFMAENKGLEVWLAPVESAHVLLPLRVSVLTMIGTLVIEASNFTVTK